MLSPAEKVRVNVANAALAILWLIVVAVASAAAIWR